MSDSKPIKEELIGPQLAVQRYLDELLQEATLTKNVTSDASEELKAVEESVTLEGEVEASITDDDQSIEVDASESLELASDQAENDVDLSDEPLHRNSESSSESKESIASLDAAFADFENAVAEMPVSEAFDESVQPVEASCDLDASELDGFIEDKNTQEHLLENVGSPSVQSDATELSDQAQEMLVHDDEVGTENLSTSVLVEEKKNASKRVKIETDLSLINEESSSLEKAPSLSKTEPLPWAQSRFDCLLFKVGGLKMAVPLVELGGIQKADKNNLTAIFGQPDWFMGVFTGNGMHVRTVNTALWVMPNHYKDDLNENFKFVIQLDRSDWGLACEVVAEAISLEPSAVKWRSDRSKRPWLAGTVIEHMCAILDVQGFIELLNDPKNGFKAHLK